MIQGGDPTATGMGGESIYGSALKMNFHNAFNLYGALSMANSGPMLMVHNFSLFK